MKKKLLIVCSALVSLSATVIAQTTEKALYRRSTLSTILIEDNDLGKSKDMVINAYNSNPLPDKYNLHNIKDKKFAPELLKLTTEDFKNAGFYLDTLKKPIDFIKANKKPFNKLRTLNPEGTIAVMEPSKEELTNIYIDKYIKEKKIAKQIVASWYNRTTDGKMNWDLLKERALYSATADEKSEGRTEQQLKDKLIKDIDVIGNTFIVFNKMDFYANEPVARFIRDAAKTKAMESLAGKPQMMIDKTMKGLDDVYEKTKEGYTVKCNTYLYQLDWNENIAKKTNDYFFNSNITNPNSIWDTTNLYKVKFVGKTVSASIVTFKIGEKRTEEQIISLQVKRTIDNAMAKLQKSYVQFRPVSPIAQVGPLQAKIGMKEGLEPGQTFEILATEWDEFGIPHYKRTGKIKVDKKLPVWDNRQGAEPELDADGKPKPVQEFTTFKGGDKAELINVIRLLK
jgi:hypothetical protein